MLGYAILMMIMSIVIFGVILLSIIQLLKLKRATTLTFDNSNTNFDEQAILLSPTRPLIIGRLCIVTGGSLSIMNVIGSLVDKNDFSQPDIIKFIFLILGVLLVIIGIKILIKRNHIVQLTITKQGFSYHPLKWNPYPRRKITSPNIFLFWSKKISFIEYTQIEKINIGTLPYWGFSASNFIYVLARDRDPFYLPVLLDNTEQYKELFALLNKPITIKNQD